MKLPTDKLSDLRLHSVAPWQRFSQLADDPALLQSLKQSKGSRLAFNLLLVRPWVLVLGFWLVSVLSAAVAWEGLVSPKRLTMALPEATAEPVSETASPSSATSFIKVEQLSDQIVTEDPVATAHESGTAAGSAQQAIALDAEVTDTVTSDSSPFPVLPLLTLASGCAAGCLLISRRRAMMRMAATRSARGRGRKVRTASRTTAHRSTSQRQPAPANRLRSRPSNRQNNRQAAHRTQPARAQTAGRTVPPDTRRPAARPKKRRQRQRPAATAQMSMATETRSPLPSRSTAQRVAAQKAAPRATQTIGQRMTQRTHPKAGQRVAQRGTQKSRPAAAAARPRYRQRNTVRAASRQPMVSVVPANTAHPLDWTEGSLAHQLDVRPHRSAI